MKQSFLKCLLIIAAMCAGISCRAEKIFEALASNPHVESVYVGKSMMNMARSFLSADNDPDTKSALKAVKDINSIEIINCENGSAIKSVREQARKILAKLKLEVMLETKDGNESTVIYGNTAPAGSKATAISDMIIETSEPGEYSLIHINGTIDPTAFISE